MKELHQVNQVCLFHLLLRLVEKLSLLSTVPLEVVRMTVPVPTGKGKGKASYAHVFLVINPFHE